MIPYYSFPEKSFDLLKPRYLSGILVIVPLGRKYDYVPCSMVIQKKSA